MRRELRYSAVYPMGRECMRDPQYVCTGENSAFGGAPRQRRVRRGRARVWCEGDFSTMGSGPIVFGLYSFQLMPLGSTRNGSLEDLTRLIVLRGNSTRYATIIEHCRLQSLALTLRLTRRDSTLNRRNRSNGYGERHHIRDI